MGKPPLALEHSTFFKMLLLVNLTARPFERLYEKRYDIRLSEWRVLLTLAGRPGLTATELADLLALDKMAVSRATRRLERLERVARVVDRTDHRRANLTLTDKGWELYQRIAPAGQAREAMLLQPLDAPDLAALDSILDRLLAQARRMPLDEATDNRPRRAGPQGENIHGEAAAHRGNTQLGSNLPGATLPGATLPGAQGST